jgi:hypothetical protein
MLPNAIERRKCLIKKNKLTAKQSKRENRADRQPKKIKINRRMDYHTQHPTHTKKINLLKETKYL